MLKCLWVLACAIAIFIWDQPNLLAAEVTLDQAVAIALEKNPDLAAAANELLVARGEIQRAEYISQFNPQVLAASTIGLGPEGRIRRIGVPASPSNWKSSDSALSGSSRQSSVINEQRPRSGIKSGF